MFLEDKEPVSNEETSETPIEENEDITSPGPVFDSENAPEVNQEVVDNAPKKGKKKKSKARNIFEWVFTAFFTTMSALTNIPGRSFIFSLSMTSLPLNVRVSGLMAGESSLTVAFTVSLGSV